MCFRVLCRRAPRSGAATVETERFIIVRAFPSNNRPFEAAARSQARAFAMVRLLHVSPPKEKGPRSEVRGPSVCFMLAEYRLCTTITPFNKSHR